MRTTKPASVWSKYSAARAFTLIELLAVAALILALTLVSIPCLTRTNPGSKTAHCWSNTKRLVTAWRLYADDNADRLVPIFHGGEAQGGNFPASIGPGWCAGWLDWTLSTDNTNLDFLLSPKYAGLARYLSNQPQVFKCPADRYISANQRSRGWSKRVRSYSVAVGIGQGNAQAGPWDTFYRTVTNSTGFLYPNPSETWVFIEEHPDSMNDPAFFSPTATVFVDSPASYHDGACAFGFADGHAEMHRWIGALTAPRVGRVAAQDGSYINNFVRTQPGDPDLHWLSYHTQRISTNSY